MSRRWPPDSSKSPSGKPGAVQGKAPEGAALVQLRKKRYADKYRRLGQPVHLIGVEFSREERNVAALAVERT